MIKKIMSIFLVFSILLGSGAAFDVVHAEGIKSKIAKSTDELDKEIDNAGGSVIEAARGIAITVMVILVLWIGYSLFISGSADSIARMKYRLGALILATILTFKTEAVIGWVFGVLNIQI